MLNNKTLLRIISVIIGIGLWLMVVTGQEEVRELSVPVKLTNVANGYIAFTNSSIISVTVKGAASLIKGLENSDVLLNMDVSKFSAGQSLRRVLASDFTTPLGIEVVDVKPGEIMINIDKVGTKNVRIVPSVIGEVHHGYVVESINIKPNMATITGAEGMISQLEAVSTQPINLSDRTENFALHVDIKEQEGVTKINPSNVEVRVRLRENMVEHEFKNVPVECMNLKESFELVNNPKLSLVKVKGREDVINSFLDSVTFVTDCSHINESGNYNGSVAYKTNVLIDILNIEPQTINLEIKNKR